MEESRKAEETSLGSIRTIHWNKFSSVSCDLLQHGSARHSKVSECFVKSCIGFLTAPASMSPVLLVLLSYMARPMISPLTCRKCCHRISSLKVIISPLELKTIEQVTLGWSKDRRKEQRRFTHSPFSPHASKYCLSVSKLRVSSRSRRTT
eukprot:Protomagalhaensia_wolfi_Nauph_80__513@NODE_128_length_3541_cov_371_143347_g53_i7_p3_GENE_NODE_128_length_3541_cov_371_143347_g53_i7NODE_128_length_3541_cov_371_143347_g53_i7_p3_ORF_typecomplete_len150_score0_43DUF5553/PF17707_1/0_0023_NODE_128_length_3541_cov_371_143347_g53_i715471996